MTHFQFSSLSHVWLFGTPWTAAHQASLFVTNSRSLLKFMSIVLVVLSNHLISSHLILISSHPTLLFLPSIFPSIRVFSNESVLRIRWPKYWSFSFSISPSNEYLGLISCKIHFSFVFGLLFLVCVCVCIYCIFLVSGYHEVLI